MEGLVSRKLCDSMNIHIPLSLILLSAALLQGCFSARVSEAFIEPSAKWRSESAGRVTSLYGPDIEIVLRTSNVVASFVKQDSDRFGISLYFDPKTQNFRFDPTEVTLLLPGKAEQKPSRINIEFAGLGKSVDWKCGNYPKIDFGPGPAYAIFRGFCVDLYFDTSPPSPDTDFGLHIAGLTWNGEQIVIPDIRFRKGSFWILDFPFMLP
jgi:hypothetical protein